MTQVARREKTSLAYALIDLGKMACLVEARRRLACLVEAQRRLACLVEAQRRLVNP